MKTILLIRHSEPIQERTTPTEALPLSEQGHRKAQELFALDIFHAVKTVYTSPYRRAYSTAEKLSAHCTPDRRFREREIGNPDTLRADFWSRQYQNHDSKNTNGESLNDVKERMTAAIVSHAAAICAFLLNWCAIEVIDSQKKIRKIMHNGAVVMNGAIATPSAFMLEFEHERLRKITYVDKENHRL